MTMQMSLLLTASDARVLLLVCDVVVDVDAGADVDVGADVGAACNDDVFCYDKRMMMHCWN